MKNEQFDFIFILNKKSYLRYGTPNLKIFITEIFEYANFYSGEYEISFLNDGSLEELTKYNFKDFLSLDNKEVHFEIKVPKKKINKLVESIKLIIKHNKKKFLSDFYSYMKKEKEKRKLELAKKLLLNEMQLIISQKNNYEKKMNKYTFYGYNKIRGESINDMLEQQSVRESGIVKFNQF